ncbi:MAG: DHA2 family efflux MFS transporter permease subunit [Luteococcus sp.]|uniref:DHA2 family efflux MFS transporter permease subunit n=1 Tax=Luteococcus sp. TaxID=1969402 RepID=UPI0026496F50|nr:DHA2 family efflux MFS transporter permease subunit [Luteococcus sp.]MDN5562600.1 DHA2 family efflux MFS transporter permease subunit [Luteococcus sp.]
MNRPPHAASAGTSPVEDLDPRAWPAMFAMAVGFFMIMIDTTIVSVSIPAIMAHFGADVTQVIWVSSAYLLTYAIPLLITGRLGDRFGPKRIYLLGLVVFTLSSLWCGLSGSIGALIAARAVQGLGAAMMSPQTMAVITRMFPARRRGAPMGLWGATASVASLAGPLLGGVLVDTVGWEWIFFVNVPIGIAAIIAVWKLVPDLETHAHSFDLLGVALNAVGLTLVVFAIQEGQAKGWPTWVLGMIAAGLLVLGVFLWQQARNTREPLMPLQLFANRNFTAANAAIFVMGAAVVAMSFPMMLYLQTARGLSPTHAALLSLPSAVVSFIGAPLVGKAANTRPTRGFAVLGFVFFGVGLLAQAELMRASLSVLWMLLPSVFLGLSGALIWGPLSMSATRDLPARWAGAGSGVYNATRQLGSVLGSAAIAAIIEWQLGLQMPSGHAGQRQAEGTHVALPGFLAEPFSVAMRHATWFPVALAVLGGLAASFLVKPQFMRDDESRAARS